MLKEFTYKYGDGPFLTLDELLSDWDTGDCRRAAQYCIYNSINIFLKPEEVLCPEAYKETGIFVSGHDQAFSFDDLIDGDIIYAERIRNKHNDPIDRSPKHFNNEDKYILHLHTALYTGDKIWHATSIEGKSCTWPIETFLHYYKPIVAKRIK